MGGLLYRLGLRYILNMQNLSNGVLTKEQRDFIGELATMLMHWNIPANAARLYAYLQLQEAPVSLDTIAADLEVSKSNACAAAKMLETAGNIRRLNERGSKRIFYVAGEDLGTPLRRQTEVYGMMSALIAERTTQVAKGEAQDRLVKLAAFHRDLQEAMEGVIIRHKRGGAT